jgi:alkylation response protein AidB-like acyl-CoA dehydrogenase
LVEDPRGAAQRDRREALEIAEGEGPIRRGPAQAVPRRVGAPGDGALNRSTFVTAVAADVSRESRRDQVPGAVWRHKRLPEWQKCGALGYLRAKVPAQEGGAMRTTQAL